MSFLSSMLPTIIGAGVGVATGNPYLGAAAAGAFGYSKHGSLTEGLMAGLAGYGGAGLTQGITPGMVSSELGATTANEATKASMQSAMAEQAAAAGRTASSMPIGADFEQMTASQLGKTAAGPNMIGADFEQMPSMMAANNAVTNPITTSPSISDTLAKNATFGNVSMAASPLLTQGMFGQKAPAVGELGDTDMGPRYVYNPGTATPQPGASATGVENTYFPDQGYTRISAADAKALYGYADGGNVQFPYGESVMRMARGGLSDLGGYSDGGRLLRGPGDGVSDSIPAVIGRKQPARLADGEFVVPARIVSELGNGSTEAGARQLYKMMDRVQKSRSKTTGKGKIAKNTNAARYLPA